MHVFTRPEPLLEATAHGTVMQQIQSIPSGDHHISRYLASNSNFDTNAARQQLVQGGHKLHSALSSPTPPVTAFADILDESSLRGFVGPLVIVTMVTFTDIFHGVC